MYGSSTKNRHSHLNVYVTCVHRGIESTNGCRLSTGRGEHFQRKVKPWVILPSHLKGHE